MCFVRRMSFNYARQASATGLEAWVKWSGQTNEGNAMLIKIFNDEPVEFPDNLAALTLIDLFFGHDVPAYSLEHVNALVHRTLKAFFEETLTLEQNIAAVRSIYASQRAPSAAKLEKALTLIRHYNENIAVEDIARVRPDLIFPCDDEYNPIPGYTIDQPHQAGC